MMMYFDNCMHDDDDNDDDDDDDDGNLVIWSFSHLRMTMGMVK